MSDPRPAPEPAIEARNLSKWFDQKVAVSEFTCSFGPGVTGLLGPNGAGKTTLIRTLTGLLKPSAGQALIWGESPRRRPGLYRRIGFVPENDAIYENMTAARFVRWSTALCQAPRPAEAARRALETVELTADAHRRLGEFSKGMRRRARVAAALAHDPEILILDEPLNGTDPIQRARLMELLIGLGREGRTVIVSSHVLAEVERMADRVVAMVNGRLAAAGTVADIRDAMSDTPRRVLIETDRPRELARRLLTGEWVRALEMGDGSFTVSTDDARALGRDVMAAAREEGCVVTAVTPEDESLESVFAYLVRR